MEPREVLLFQKQHLESALCEDRGSTCPPRTTADHHDVEPLSTSCGFGGKSSKTRIRPRSPPAGAEYPCPGEVRRGHAGRIALAILHAQCLQYLPLQC